MQVALYARVSTETQEKEATIESQLAKLRDLAAQHRYTWTDALTYVDDGYSGTRLDRPALDQLRDDAREGRFTTLLVTCPDRLARRYAYQVLVLEELARAGCQVVFGERAIAETPDDQLLLQIQGVIAEYERAKILERTRRGRLYRARLGQAFVGKAPYGYRYLARKTGGGGTFVVDEPEAQMIRQIFQWYAGDQLSLFRVVQRLNASAWRTRAGNKYWSPTTVARILRNSFYIGRWYVNRTMAVEPVRPRVPLAYRKNLKSAVRLRPRDEWIEIAVPAIIEPELFDRAQAQRAVNARFADRRTKRDGIYLLKGLLTCGHCGRALVGEGRGLLRQHDFYYTCTTRCSPTAVAVAGRCPAARVRASGLNDVVWAIVVNLLTQRDALHVELDRWAAENEGGPEAPLGRALEHAERALHDLQRQEQRLLDAYLLGAVSLEAFKPRSATLLQQKAQAHEHVLKLQRERQAREHAEALTQSALAFAADLEKVLADTPFHVRQQILRLLVERIIVKDDHLEIRVALPVSGNIDLTLSGHDA